MNGTFEMQEKCGFKAGDGNLHRYVSNDPMNLIDPSGLQESRMIQIYYDPAVAKGFNNFARDFVKKRLTETVAKYAKNATVNVVFLPVKGAAEMVKVKKAWEKNADPTPPAWMFVGNGWGLIARHELQKGWQVNQKTVVRFKLDEVPTGFGDGQGHDYEMVVYPHKMKSSMDVLQITHTEQTDGVAYGTVLLHELIAHAISGGKHADEDGEYVDSSPAKYGGTISPEGAKRFIRDLGLEFNEE